jgi:hypothetical protein
MQQHCIPVIGVQIDPIMAVNIDPIMGVMKQIDSGAGNQSPHPLKKTM